MVNKLMVKSIEEGLEGYLYKLSKIIRENEESLADEDREAIIEALLLAKNDLDYLIKVYLIK